jgi:hypothetical protein
MVDDPRLAHAASSLLSQPISVGNLLLKNWVIALPIGLLAMLTARALQPERRMEMYRRRALEELVVLEGF